MGAHIKFSMEHRYFRDWLEVDVDWNYPFLPRVGEFVNAWIWIEAGKFSRADIEKILNPDGQENLNSEFYRDYTSVYCNFIIYTIVNMESARFIFLETNITFEPACQRVSSLHLRFRRIQ